MSTRSPLSLSDTGSQKRLNIQCLVFGLVSLCRKTIYFETGTECTGFLILIGIGDCSQTASLVGHQKMKLASCSRKQVQIILF